jgi:enterobactin synthetase component D
MIGAAVRELGPLGPALPLPLMDGTGFGIATREDCVQIALHPAEEQRTLGMLPGRRREFWMGRSAARRALRELGTGDGPILTDGRRPVFPSGVTGSLSHSAGIAVAIVAPSDRMRGLGIDLELRRLPAGAGRLVLAPEEAAGVAAGRYSCAEAFSAKEAAFKALEPLLHCGATTLRQMRIERVEAGFKVWLVRWPHLPAVVSIRHLSCGILAWTAIGWR